MKYNIKVTKTKNSGLDRVDFDNIPFGKVFSDHMFVADYVDGQWTDLRIEPFGPFLMHPANLALHYGQSIFEGMKATVDKDGRALLFRPEMHAHRINASATRMCMPTIPEDLFQEALELLVDLDRAWIPPKEGSALYIRPLLFANSNFIGVQPSEQYRFIIMTGPVGPYYNKPVKLLAQTDYVRAVKGGVGEAKTAGNYAASLLPTKLAKEQGYDQILWLDAKEYKYVQEVGTMNIFFVIDGKVITPATEGTILKGITRDTIIHLLEEKGYAVEQRPLSMDEIIDAYQKGTLQEVFGSGTAAVVTMVSHIKYKDLTMTLPDYEHTVVARMAKDTIDGIRSGRVQDTHEWLAPVKQHDFALS